MARNVRTIRPEATSSTAASADLCDDQRVARAVALAAFARAARAVLQRRRHVRPRVLDDRDRAEQQAGADRDRQREQQHDRIERDLVQPRQLRGLQIDEQLDAAVGQRGADGAAERSRPAATRTSTPRPRAALRRQARGGSPVPAAAPRRAPGTGWRRSRTRPAAPGRPCRAESTASRRCRRPHQLRAAAPAIRTAHRRTSSCVKPCGSGKRSVSDRQQPLDVGVGLRDGHAGLEPRQALVVEAGGVNRRAVELQRHDHLRVGAKETGSLRAARRSLRGRCR